MNRSSSIAFYMQTLAICDVAFFALRVLFGELSSLSANKHILTTGLCKFLFLMVNAVNYTTVWLIAAMNADKFLAVCLPLRVSDLLSRKKAYGVVITVIICSMLVASVHASRTVLKNNAYCWLKTAEDEKLVFILDAFFWCFIPFIVISILNAAIFLALFRARRDASLLHESTSITRTASNPFRSSVNNRARMQSQNLQITVMLITISISFFVLTLPNAIYYLMIFLRVFIESWKAVKCDTNVYRNLDTYVQTSAVIGARFRNEFRRLIFYKLCRWCCKQQNKLTHKDNKGKSAFIRVNGATTIRTLPSCLDESKQHSTSNNSCTAMMKDKRFGLARSPTNNLSSGGSKKLRQNQYMSSGTDVDDKKESGDLIRQ
ncbi:unnamed protein product [Adineta ricciae]|uniref:G-protein coupled receptors family 1 profile domain-containing protein n=1 Tax=Adineta ricciae TaxID=249248 RepID=A0A814IFT5_ADIRI|nr:unnamed protein product [Adineta ricciae]